MLQNSCRSVKIEAGSARIIYDDALNGFGWLIVCWIADALSVETYARIDLFVIFFSRFLKFHVQGMF